MNFLRYRKVAAKIDNTREEEVITWGFEHMSLQQLLMGGCSTENMIGFVMANKR